jgi:hypothetical protein
VVWNGSAVFSGLSNGLEIMLDAEVYDNADPEANSDGFHILVTDPEVQNFRDMNFNFSFIVSREGIYMPRA